MITDLPEEVRKKEENEKIAEQNLIEFFCFRKKLSRGTRVCLGVFVFLVLLAISCLVCYFILTWKGWIGDEDEPSGAFNISILYKPSESELGIYNHAAISTDTAPCAVVGKNILLKNGSAVDAAIATLSCMGVVNPQSLGLGGGFIMTIYIRKTKKAVVYDARETAPKKATFDMFKGNKELAQTGGLAVAVPGELIGYEDVHTEYGKLDWKELFNATIELCRKGFPVGRHLAETLQQHRDDILNETSLREVFVNNKTGDVFKENEIMTRNDLAKTFEAIAKDKSEYLYGKGGVRAEFVKEIQDFGGIITEEDMELYSPKERQPTIINLNNGMIVYSSPSPGSGELLSFMLNILDGYNLTESSNWETLQQVTSTLHRLIETFKFTYAQRMQLEDSEDSNTQQVVKNLLNREYADATRRKIYENKTINDPEYYGVKVGYQDENHGTAHLSVLAPNGDAVAVTSTINLYFGSKRRSRSTGIILNNEMDDFSSPNITNYFALPPTEKNRIVPGRRPMSSMCPTIVTDANGDVQLIIGGNGGTQITSGVALVATQLLWLEKNIKEAIDMPRIHHQLFPEHISHEKAFPKSILAQLQKRGHHTEPITGRMSIIMGVHRGKDGKLYANADYRKGGSTSGF